MTNALLENWRKSATRRAEFAALMQEPTMLDAIAIVKEALFKPLSPPLGLSPMDRMAWFGEMGLRREAYLEMLTNFMSLASLHPFKEKAQELQKKKPWETADKEAGEKKILDEFYGGSPPPLEGITGTMGPQDEPGIPVPEQKFNPPQT